MVNGGKGRRIKISLSIVSKTRVWIFQRINRHQPSPALSVILPLFLSITHFAFTHHQTIIKFILLFSSHKTLTSQIDLYNPEMSEVFDGYEQQYCELSANLSRKCSSVSLLSDQGFWFEQEGSLSEARRPHQQSSNGFTRYSFCFVLVNTWLCHFVVSEVCCTLVVSDVKQGEVIITTLNLNVQTTKPNRIFRRTMMIDFETLLSTIFMELQSSEKISDGFDFGYTAMPTANSEFNFRELGLWT